MSALTVVETDLAYKTREKHTQKHHRQSSRSSSSAPTVFSSPEKTPIPHPSTNPDSRRTPTQKAHPPKTKDLPPSPGAGWSISYLHPRPSSRARLRARARSRDAPRASRFPIARCLPTRRLAPSRARLERVSRARGRSPATDHRPPRIRHRPRLRLHRAVSASSSTARASRKHARKTYLNLGRLEGGDAADERGSEERGHCSLRVVCWNDADAVARGTIAFVPNVRSYPVSLEMRDRETRL